MLTSFVLSLALAAQPPDAPPTGSGLAPRILELKADAAGKVLVHVIRTETVKIQVALAGGGTATKETQLSRPAIADIAEVKDLKITTVGGKKIDLADAKKMFKEGVVVVLSADGNPIDAKYLKVLKDDVMVLVAPGLSHALPVTDAPAPTRPAAPPGE